MKIVTTFSSYQDQPAEYLTQLGYLTMMHEEGEWFFKKHVLKDYTDFLRAWSCNLELTMMYCQEKSDSAVKAGYDDMSGYSKSLGKLTKLVWSEHQ